MKSSYNSYQKLIILIILLVASGNIQSQSLKIDQTKEDTFLVDITTPVKDTNLSWSDQPDSRKKSQIVKLKSQEEILTISSPHPILKLKAKGEKEFYAAPRLLVLRGAVNFRDLGGYVTKDNKEVKWGKIYRSADISKLTDEDLLKLATLNIKTVCDLRGPAEVSAAPDRLPTGATLINLPAGSENIGTPGSFMKYMKNPATADSIMRSVYVKNDFYKAKYKPMFDQLLELENDKAILFHCTAGKDRTGIGAALILYALGVDESTILKDYELTNAYRKSANESMIKMMTSQGISEAAAKRMMAADPSYLKGCFSSLTTNYGSIDQFLENEIGLTKERRDLLKKKFLY